MRSPFVGLVVGLLAGFIFGYNLGHGNGYRDGELSVQNEINDVKDRLAKLEAKQDAPNPGDGQEVWHSSDTSLTIRIALHCWSFSNEVVKNHPPRLLPFHTVIASANDIPFEGCQCSICILLNMSRLAQRRRFSAESHPSRSDLSVFSIDSPTSTADPQICAASPNARCLS